MQLGVAFLRFSLEEVIRSMQKTFVIINISTSSAFFYCVEARGLEARVNRIGTLLSTLMSS